MTDGLLELDTLLASWLITLRAERKSPSTLRAYEAGIRGFITYCENQGIPGELTKPNVIGYMASLSGQSSATAQLRLRAVKLFARWLADEEGFTADPILAVRPPKLDQPVVPHLSDRELTAMIKACDGPGFRDKRDKAVLMLAAETTARADELVALTVDDVSVADCTILVARGKGGKGRKSKFSPQTAAALDKYMRARRQAGHKDGALFMGERGRPLSYSGLKYALKQRSVEAGVPNFHLHRLRHTGSVRWLRAGGSEAGLMAQAGWQSRKMIDRYVKSAHQELAAEEFDRLGIGVGG